MWRLPAALLVVLGLGCAGLMHPEVDLLEVDRHVAVEAGYVLPIEARNVFVRDRASAEVRTTWFRYDLDHEALTELEEELASDPEVQRIEDPAPPEHWPDFGTVEFEAPEWWLPPPAEGEPAGRHYRREIPSDPPLSAAAQGRQWTIHDEGQVYVWMWSWEAWPLPAPKPTPSP